MQSKIILASLVAAVSANNLLTMRQVGSPLSSLSKECQADLEEVQNATDLPSIPTAFITDALQAAQTLTDPCSYTPTGTVASEYTSFVSAAESWASAHPSIASKIEKDCNAALQNIADLCPSDGASTTGGAGKTTSGSASSASATDKASGSGASATSSGGDAAKATSSDGKSSAAANGPVAAGALMVAALGAVALL